MAFINPDLTGELKELLLDRDTKLQKDFFDLAKNSPPGMYLLPPEANMGFQGKPGFLSTPLLFHLLLLPLPDHSAFYFNFYCEKNGIQKRHPTLEMSGVYFVKKGIYRGAVVKFSITVGDSYPLFHEPVIRLLGPPGIVLNNLKPSKKDEGKAPKLSGLKWDAEKHSLRTVLDYLAKEIDNFAPIDEEDEFKALEWIEKSKEQAFERADKDDVFFVHGGESGWTWEHEEVRDKLIQAASS